MRIKLTVDIPVHHAHGLTEGREMEVVQEQTDRYVRVRTDTGDLAVIHPGEYEMIDENQTD